MTRSLPNNGPLFEIPPFPGRSVDAFVRGPGSAITESEARELVVMIREGRVGGSFWGPQPVMRRDVKVATPEATAFEPQDDGTIIPGAHLPPDTDPWHILAHASEIVTTADDPLAVLAGIAGVPSRLVDQPAQSSPVDWLIAHFATQSYHCPFSGDILSPNGLINMLVDWRKMIDANRPIHAALGFAFWKQEAAAPLLWGGGEAPRFVTAPGKLPEGKKVATWTSKVTKAAEAQIQAAAMPRIEVEDGFIRSAGLGADCVPPQSLVADSLGIYFDPTGPSQLETILETADFSDDEIAKAEALRALILETGVSKYESSTTALRRPAGARRYVLVTGQVEDDRSVQLGGGAVQTNLELLRRARAREPEAYLIYKPHPDVEAGHRKGIVQEGDALALADMVATQQGIAPLLEMVDHLHVLTSLAGFEALIRGKSVTTHGVPFYAGWGLTEDLGSVPARRTRKRTVDELVVAALMRYPRYLDPQTGLPCGPETLIRRLSAQKSPKSSAIVTARRLQGRMRAKIQKWTGER